MTFSRAKRLTLPLAAVAFAALATACSSANPSGSGWSKTGVKGVETHGNVGGHGRGVW